MPFEIAEERTFITSTPSWSFVAISRGYENESASKGEPAGMFRSN